MEGKNKVNFEEYDIDFDEKEFDNLSNEELEECKEIIEDIKKKLDE